jgi:hypothetical protein
LQLEAYHVYFWCVCFLPYLCLLLLRLHWRPHQCSI